MPHPASDKPNAHNGRRNSSHGLRRSHGTALRRYASSVIKETYLFRFALSLLLLWLLFATALFFVEQRATQPVVSSFSEALYWGVAAFSTAGIADTPSSPLSQLIGGLWIVIGSVIFFGIIVGTITGYFMRPVQRPFRRLINLIEYNLEHLQELTIEELDLLRETTDALILHMERIKEEAER